MLATIPVLSDEYEVSFVVCPSSTLAGQATNIMWIRIDGDDSEYDDGSNAEGIIFGVSVIPSKLGSGTKFQINGVCINEKGEECKAFVSNKIYLQKWIKIDVKQMVVAKEIMVNGVKTNIKEHVYTIHFNGAEMYRKVNSKPQIFNNARVCASQPWLGAIKNFNVVNQLGSGKGSEGTHL